MTDGHHAPAVVRHIVESRPEAAVLTRQLEGADFDPQGTMLEIRTAAGSPTVALADGPLDGRYLVVDDSGAPTGEVLVWIEDGRLSAAEYAWYTDEAPDAWPDPARVRIE
jgi:hypothetical protein